ncbi:cytochrome P450 [Actinomadura sp. GTD37]|uniref:cytochrome P450 n=1 Tax=Actinomadura sp. GTD37 TaxID=1778030 RepID=UPI0035C06B8C
MTEPEPTPPAAGGGPAAAEDPPAFPMRRSGCPYDPPPEYAELREHAPVSRAALADGRRVWLIARHADAVAALSDARISGDLRSPGFPLPGGAVALPPGVRPSFARMDPPDHAVFRRLLLPDFTVRKVRELRPRIERIVGSVLDDLAGRGRPADLVEAVALPIPSLVVCELLGIPYADHEFFQSLALVLLDRSSTPEQLKDTLGQLRSYMHGLLAAKRDDPGDDILTKLARAGAGDGAGHELSDDDLAITAQTVLSAGHETTANMIALGTLVLLENPAALDDLRADPALWPGAVEELLRYLSISDLVSPRAAREDLKIGDAAISAGEGMFVLTGSANRDPAAFTDPDVLDVRRSARGHLAFGSGVHQCLGQNLARAELEITYEALFRRFPGLSLAVPLEDLPFKHRAALFGLNAMPVTW